MLPLDSECPAPLLAGKEGKGFPKGVQAYNYLCV